MLVVQNECARYQILSAVVTSREQNTLIDILKAVILFTIQQALKLLFRVMERCEYNRKEFEKLTLLASVMVWASVNANFIAYAYVFMKSF